uniref:Retrotransposon Copia-like N-terminal domain-containing protein n=1 Tax=Cajanus cajan TaxID=3821 RepID=A0A151UEU7_CAJCA
MAAAEGTIIRKTISPYDITSNDNPGSLITQVKLKGKNYDEWARSIRSALRARKKFGFVDGTIQKSTENSPDIKDWLTNNSLLVSWIMNTIEPSLRSTILHMEVAQDLWTNIKEHFSVANGPRIQQLKAELVECKQKSMTIIAYYGKLKKLWEELGNFDQIPTCSCGLCTCKRELVLVIRVKERIRTRSVVTIIVLDMIQIVVFRFLAILTSGVVVHEE